MSTEITPKVAKACLEVARADKARVKEHKFIPPYAHKQDTFVLSDFFARQQADRLATCDERIRHYKDIVDNTKTTVKKK